MYLLYKGHVALLFLIFNNVSCTSVMLFFFLLIYYFCQTQESDMLCFIRLLKSMLMVSNAVAIVTFPPSMLSPSSSTRLQHMADTLLSIKAIPGVFPWSCLFVTRLLWLFLTCALTFFFTDGDKDLEKLLTGYKDINGFLNVHKVARINTQVSSQCRHVSINKSLMKSKFLPNHVIQDISLCLKIV